MTFRTKSTGFTLMEMLVALAMAAAVVTPLFVITRGVSETSRAKQMEVEAMQRARTAMDLLIRDFSRAGLFTSPNTVADSRFFNKDTAGSSVQYRGAVSHLNRGSDEESASGNDAIMLTGNFLGSNTYTAYAIGQYKLRLVETMETAEECTRQFNPNYAVAHISDNSGKDLEADIVNVTLDDEGHCTVDISPTDYHPHSYKPGDFVFVSANQTAVYLVEGTDLVRYFVAPANPGGANSGNCTINPSVSTVGSYTDLLLTGAVQPATRQVFANYVVNFQVWFRPITPNGDWAMPHYHTIAQVTGLSSGNYADGFTLPESLHVVPLAPGSKPNVADVSCNALLDDTDSGLIGPERVRSAIVQITVRTEKSDGSMRWTSDTPGRLERHALAPVPTDTEGIPVPDGEHPFAYQLRTVTTEIAMPNLAARSDL